MQLREGMSEQISETRMRYRRLPQPPRVAYTLRALSGGEEAPRQFILAPGESRRLGLWRFSHDQEHLGAASVAVLRAKRAPGTLIQYLGLLCFMLGLGGLCILRLGRRRRPLRDSNDLENAEAWVEVDPDRVSGDATTANERKSAADNSQIIGS